MKISIEPELRRVVYLKVYKLDESGRMVCHMRYRGLAEYETKGSGNNALSAIVDALEAARMLDDEENRRRKGRSDDAQSTEDGDASR